MLCKIIVFLKAFHAFPYLLGRQCGVFLKQEKDIALVELVAAHLCEYLLPMFKDKDKGFADFVFAVIEVELASLVDHLLDFSDG